MGLLFGVVDLPWSELSICAEGFSVAIGMDVVGDWLVGAGLSVVDLK